MRVTAAGLMVAPFGSPNAHVGATSEAIPPMATRQGENPDVLHRKAQVRVFSSMAAGGDDVFELIGALAAFDVHHHFTPDVALLEVAATALGLACLPGSDPLEYEGLTDRYLPDQMLSGRTLRQRTQYAI
jgi:hypothetical protein